jgi:hypothetical protein
MKKTFPQNFQKVVDYIYSVKGVQVELSDSTCFLGHKSKTIYIHRAYNLEKNGLFALLHECGHALQPVTNVGVNCYKNIDEELKPQEFAMKRFINELDAWEKGLQIASELGIYIDIKKYEKEKDIALLTYFV